MEPLPATPGLPREPPSASTISSRRHQSPDSPVRTRIAFESGHRRTSSGAAARIVTMSLSLSFTPLAERDPAAQQ